VTNPDAGTVTVVDLKTLKVTDIIPVGKNPLKIDINTDDTKAYVTNFGSDDVSVIDLKIKSVVKIIPVGRNPYGVVVTPDGDLVYVANYSSPFLSVIDADPTSGGFNHVVANVSTGTNNQEITVTGDAGLVLVTGRDGLKIVCSNPSDLKFNTVVSNVSSGTVTNDVTVTGDAGYALVTTENNSILIVDINPKSDLFGAAVANVSTSTQPGDIVISGDAMFVYVTNTDADKISVYKLSYGASGTINGSFGTYPTLVLYNEIAIKDSIDAPEGLVIDPMNQRLFVVNSGAETGKSSLAVIRICCGPVAPSTSIGELVITIQTMINLGIVKEAAGLELIGHLNSSLANYTAGKVKTAINNLNTFIVKVKDLVKSRRITKEQGQALIDAANAIIAQMRGPQSKLTESPSDGNEPFGNTELFNNTELSDPEMITESKLGVIYPNPFSETVTINYEIAENGESTEKVLIRVYDISGRLVGTLINKTMQAGSYTVQWKGNYESGGPAPYGTYFVLFRAGKIEEVREIMLSR
jgi:YVTN family beta-propeller protein